MAEYEPTLAMVATMSPELPAPAALTEALAAWGVPGTVSAEEGVLTAQVRLGDRDVPVVITGIDVPHPGSHGEAMGVAPADPAIMAETTAHLIVSVLGRGSLVDEEICARVTSAVVSLRDDVAGIFHGPTPAPMHPRFYTAMVEDTPPGTFPLPACLGTTIGPEGHRRLGVLSHGLSRWGRDELYLVAPRDRATQAAEFLWDLAAFVLDRPPGTISPGETVGRTPEETLPVKLDKSPVGDGTMVLRIELP